jgi:ribosome-associated toxin RatA of RatAB toxin-antitoxin module
MGAQRAEQSTVIAAPPERCFAAITDFESYPQWQSAVKRCAVRERDSDGRASLVETVIDVRLREVRYVLRYSYEPPRVVRWDYVEGDIKSVEGEYLFEDAGDGATRATYRLALDPGRFLPGPLRKLLVDGVMRTSVRELKTRAEGA